MRFIAEIRRLRIERAKRMLMDTDEPVKYIAFAAGFSSSAQMYQVFQQFVGMSPTAFRVRS
jgi:AraC-like DNA-binding protein